MILATNQLKDRKGSFVIRFLNRKTDTPEAMTIITQLQYLKQLL